MATPGDSKRRRSAAYERGRREAFAEAGNVADETVSRALAAFWRAQGMGWSQHSCMRSALESALRTLDNRLEKPGKGECP